MPEVHWGANSTDLHRWSSYSYAYTNDQAVPAGRAMDGGQNNVIITGIYAWVAGQGASRTVSLQFGDAVTPNFSVGTASNSKSINSGWQPVNNGGVYTAPGNKRFRVNHSGGLWIGRTNYGSTSVADRINWSGAIAGGIRYVQAPTAPQNLRATPSPTTVGAIELTWDAPSDDGGTPITGYHIYRNGTRVWSVGAGERSTRITDNSTTTASSFTVRASNWVTDWAGAKSVNSNTATATGPKTPSAPRNLTGRSTANRLGSTQIWWDAPADTAGGVTRYLIYRDTQLISSAITTPPTSANPFTDTELTPGQAYKYDVRAYNAWGEPRGIRSDKSNEIFPVASSLPTAPRSFSAVASEDTPGTITLTWLAPTSSGTATVTGYEIVQPSNGQVLKTVGNVLTTSLTGLAPGQTYTLAVRAVTSVTTGSGTDGPVSNTSSATIVGDPSTPGGVVVGADSRVTGRIRVSWAAVPGPTTSYLVYLNGTLAATLPPTVTVYIFDGLPATPQTVTVAATNTFTDEAGTVGPQSAPKSATPVTTTSQPLATSRVATNETVAGFAGTRIITATTAKTLSFVSSGADVSTGSVPAGSGDISNLTNLSYNGSRAVIVGGNPETERTFRMTLTTTAQEITAVPSGTALNVTNQTLNGTYTVTYSDALNRIIRYARTHADFGPRITGGTVTNMSNAVYNASDVALTVASDTTLSYVKTNANLPLTLASGTVLNRTVRDYYNGTHRVVATPNYRTIVFKNGYGTGSDETVISNVARYQTAMTPEALAEWLPNSGTNFVSQTLPNGFVGGVLARTVSGAARIVLPVHPGSGLYQTSSVNLTGGFSISLTDTATNFDTPPQIHAEYQTMTGEIVATLESYALSEEEQTVRWTVPGTQNGPRQLVIYITGLVPNKDIVHISHPFLVRTPLGTLPFDGPYFSGDSTNTAMVTYAWATSPHVSTRTLGTYPSLLQQLVKPPAPHARSTHSLGSLSVKYRSGWIG